MKILRSHLRTLLSLITAGFMVVPGIVYAAGGLVPCEGTEADPCTPCHVIQLLANIGNFLLSITGALVFAMFMYGAFMWIISAGNEKRVAKGKTIMVNAFIGVLIVFLSYTIITFAIFAVTGKNPMSEEAVLFGKKWGDLIECKIESQPAAPQGGSTPATTTATPTTPAAPAANTCAGWGGVCAVIRPGDPDPAGKTCTKQFADCSDATHTCCK